MALFSECMLECARKVLDTADIVRDACSQQLSRCNIPRVKASVEGVCLIEGGF